jgi:hypothetical protein
MSTEPPPEWAVFLKELDSLLDEPFELHCIGGFAAAGGAEANVWTFDFAKDVVMAGRANLSLREIANSTTPRSPARADEPCVRAPAEV